MRNHTAGPEASTDKTDVDPSLEPEMSREFKRFLADMQDLIEATTADQSSHFESVQERINERVTEVKESVEALAADVDKRARKTVTDANDLVHASPWMAVGIGAAAGVLLGLVLARRS